MPTLYVENVPRELYEALRQPARKQRTPLSAEVISILEASVPTASQLKARGAFFEYIKEFQKTVKRGRRPYITAEEMIREDRDR